MNESNHARRIAIASSAGAYTEVIVAHACRFVEVRQLPTETQEEIDVRLRSAADADAITDQIAAGELWNKGRDSAGARPPSNQLQVGDTIGWFRSTGAALTLLVREHTL